MPIVYSGRLCARRGCRCPVWKDLLCVYCWRLARFMGKDPRMLAYEPLHGYGDDRDAVELPWERWEREAAARGGGVVDLFAEAPPDGGSESRRRGP